MLPSAHCFPWGQSLSVYYCFELRAIYTAFYSCSSAVAVLKRAFRVELLSYLAKNSI